MKEQIKEKLEKVVSYILNKDEKDISYSEYKILTEKLSNIEFEETKDERNKEMAEMMTKLWVK